MEDGPIESVHAAGWYPDPAGEHDHRYHNGTDWTADVATGGVRGVQPLPPPPGRRPTTRSGTLPLVLGVVAMTVGWVPFVSFVMLAVAIVAIGLGVRRRHGSGSAVAGIVTGSVGLVFSLAGVWLSVVIVTSIAAFERPGAHEAEITECVEVDGVTRATGTITNLESNEASYTVTITFDGTSTASTSVDDVAPGDEVVFVVEEDLRYAELECRIDEINGPRPFGLDLTADD